MGNIYAAHRCVLELIYARTQGRHRLRAANLKLGELLKHGRRAIRSVIRPRCVIHATQSGVASLEEGEEDYSAAERTRLRLRATSAAHVLGQVGNVLERAVRVRRVKQLRGNKADPKVSPRPQAVSSCSSALASGRTRRRRRTAWGAWSWTRSSSRSKHTKTAPLPVSASFRS